MTTAIWFWILMLLWAVFGFGYHWPAGPTPNSRWYWPVGWNILLFLIVLVLGIAQFGSPFKG